MTSTPTLRSPSVAVRLRGARADHDHRRVAGAAHELGVRGQAGLGVEDHPPRLATDALDTGRQKRVVVRHGVDAHGHGVALRAPAVSSRAAGLAGDPLRVPGGGGHLAVEGHRRLEDHQRAARAGMLAERLVEQPGRVRHLAVHGGDRDALVSQHAQPAARRLLARVVGGHHHARDARLGYRVGARGRAPRVGSMAPATRTWWRRWGPPRRHARATRSAWGSPALAWKPSPITRLALDHDRSHERVGRRLATRVAGQLDGPAEMANVAALQPVGSHP